METKLNYEEIIIVFDTWGQRCETVITNEENAWKWLHSCYSYGFLTPVEMLNAKGSVLYDEDSILEKLREE